MAQNLAKWSSSESDSEEDLTPCFSDAGLDLVAAERKLEKLTAGFYEYWTKDACPKSSLARQEPQPSTSAKTNTRSDTTLAKPASATGREPKYHPLAFRSNESNADKTKHSSLLSDLVLSECPKERRLRGIRSLLPDYQVTEVTPLWQEVREQSKKLEAKVGTPNEKFIRLPKTAADRDVENWSRGASETEENDRDDSMMYWGTRTPSPEPEFELPIVPPPRPRGLLPWEIWPRFGNTPTYMETQKMLEKEKQNKAAAEAAKAKDAAKLKQYDVVWNDTDDEDEVARKDEDERDDDTLEDRPDEENDDGQRPL